MQNPRVAALVRRFVCASVDKSPKLSTQMPNSLKKVSLLSEPEKWFNVALKDILRQAKISGAGKVSGGGRGHVSKFGMQPLPRLKRAAHIDMTWEIVSDISGDGGHASCFDVPGTIVLDLTGKGNQEVYAQIIEYFRVLPLIQTLLDVKSVLESVTGTPFVISYENYSLSNNTAFVEYKGGDSNFHYLIEGSLSVDDLPDWRMALDDRGAQVTKDFKEATLEALLEHVPAEGDSDLLWFSDKKRAKQMIAKLEQILGTKPKKWDLPEPREVVSRSFAPLVRARGMTFRGYDGLINYNSVTAKYMQDEIWDIRAQGSIPTNFISAQGEASALQKVDTKKVIMEPSMFDGGSYTFYFETQNYSLEDGFQEVSDFFKSLQDVILN